MKYTLLAFLLFFLTAYQGFTEPPVSIYERTNTEPIFMLLDPKREEMIDARKKAQDSFGAFHQAILDQKYPGSFFNVKAYFPEADGSKGAHIWLWVREMNFEGYFCQPFELPSDFTGLKADQKVLLKKEDIEDWMIIHEGTLYGGFSLRVQRAHTPDAEKSKYDEFIGVKEYSSKMP